MVRRRVAALAAIALAAAALATGARESGQPGPHEPPVVAGACATPGWVSVWTMPTSDDSGAALPAGITLREIVYPHLGGRQVRVHLSNEFSATPVTVGGATVGLRQSGPAVAPNLATLRFDGAADVTIAPGGEVVSDPAAFTFNSLQSLSVSVYLISADATPAEHLAAQQLNYQAAGDLTADVSGAGFAKSPQTGNSLSPFSSTTIVSGVDAYAPSTQGAVVTLGDSITDGLLVGAAHPPDVRWPDVLARRLLARGASLSVVNAGISGNFVTRDSFPRPCGLSAEHRFASDVAGQAGVKTVIVFEGINDIHKGVHAPALEAADMRIIAAAHAAGLRILLATLTPSGIAGDGGLQAPATRQRLALNAWIRSQRLADGVIEFGAAVTNPAAPAELDPKYDGGDHLHMSPAGYARLGAAVPLSILLPAGCLAR